MARQPAEKAGQQATGHQVAPFEAELAQTRRQLEPGEPQHQEAHHQLDRRHRGCAPRQFVLSQRLQGREQAQQGRAGDCRKDGRYAEPEHGLAICETAQQGDLEDVVGAVHHRRGRHRHLDREEQREHRQQQGAQPETGVQRQARREGGCQGDEQVTAHSAAWATAWLQTRIRLPPRILAMASSLCPLSSKAATRLG